MRLFILFVMGICLAGCVRPASKQTSSLNPNRHQQFVTFDNQQIAEMKQKLQLLRPGMSTQQALAVLGLSQYEGRLYMGGAHSGWTGNIYCRLAEGHSLWLSYEDVREQNSSRILDARIDDQTWSASDTISKH